jgi:hypothetical protein
MTGKQRARVRVVALAGMLADMRNLLDLKGERLGWSNPWGERGTPLTQVYATGGKRYLHVMEGGYRETLWPRLVWTSDDVPDLDVGDHADAVRRVYEAERASPDRILARVDGRMGRTLLWFDPKVFGVPMPPKEDEERYRAAGRARAAAEVAGLEAELEAARQSLAYWEGKVATLKVDR